MNSTFRTCVQPVVLVSRRHFKYRIRLKGKFTPTLENQYDLLKWTVEPYVGKPYEEQLKVKHSLMQRHMKKVANGLRVTYPDTRFPPNLAKIVEENDGLLCPLEPVLPSPMQTQQRFKEELSVGPDINGVEGTVGLFIGRHRKGIICVGTEHLVTARHAHKRMAKAYQNFIHQSKFLPCNTDWEGHWKPIRLRSNVKGETMATITFHPQQLTQNDIEEAKKEILDYFIHGSGKRECDFTSLLFQTCSRVRCSGSESPFVSLHGPPHIHEKVCGLTFRISPGAFFQINVPCAEVLFNSIREIADVSKSTVVLDVCCGTGTIGQTMARHVKQVIGVESVSQALDDAVHNSDLNGLTNTAYHCGRAEKVLTQLMADESLKNEQDIVAILNPGRGGMGVKVLSALRECEAVRKVIYVSCKPHGMCATNFVKLCQMPKKKVTGKPFMLTRTVPVDMFPQTRHCELILVFER